MKRYDYYHFAKHLGSISIRYICAYLLSFFKHSAAGRKILIVKMDALGDQVISSFVLEYIRKAFSHCSITILVQKQVEEFYQWCPYIDHVDSLEKNAFFRKSRYALHEILRIRKERFSAVIHVVHSRDPAGEQMTTASGARRIIGLAGDVANEPKALKKVYDGRYTELVPEWDPVPAFEGHRYLSLPKHLGFEVAESDWRPMIWIRDSHRAEAREILAGLGMKEKGFALLAPGAGDRMRCWNTEGFSVIGDRLIGEKGLEALLVGAAGEEDLANHVMAGMRFPGKSLVGKTSTSLLAALSSAASIVVGNESAPIHFSVASGTPAVCVIGGGHYGRFLPYPGRFPLRCVTNEMECFGCDWACKYDVPYCITRVQPEQVWNAVSELLDARAEDGMP